MLFIVFERLFCAGFRIMFIFYEFPAATFLLFVRRSSTSEYTQVLTTVYTPITLYYVTNISIEFHPLRIELRLTLNTTFKKSFHILIYFCNKIDYVKNTKYNNILLWQLWRQGKRNGIVTWFFLYSYLNNQTLLFPFPE